MMMMMMMMRIYANSRKESLKTTQMKMIVLKSMSDSSQNFPKAIKRISKGNQYISRWKIKMKNYQLLLKIMVKENWTKFWILKNLRIHRVLMFTRRIHLHQLLVKLGEIDIGISKRNSLSVLQGEQVLRILTPEH